MDGLRVAKRAPMHPARACPKLIVAGQWQQGDLYILVVLDAGYDAPRIAYLLGSLPVEILGRMRSDRVLRRPVPPRTPGTNGRPPKHGGEFVFGDSSTWGSEQAVTTADTRLYGIATAQAWDRLHPRLTRRAAWTDHEGSLPVIAGTIIRLKVDQLSSGGDPKPVRLWWSKVDASEPDVDRCWQAFLRRFDIEHTFRLFKQTLGWTVPKVRDPQAADSWTWLMIVVHTQLRLARPLTTDLRRPWEKPVEPDRLTPARVRRGFRNLRAKPALRRVHRNRPDQVPDGHLARRIRSPHNVTTWDVSSPPARHTSARPTTRRAPSHAEQVKDQAESSACAGGVRQPDRTVREWLPGTGFWIRRLEQSRRRSRTRRPRLLRRGPRPETRPGPRFPRCSRTVPGGLLRGSRRWFAWLLHV